MEIKGELDKREERRYTLIKSKTQTAVINMVNQRIFIINLTFRTLATMA